MLLFSIEFKPSMYQLTGETHFKSMNYSVYITYVLLETNPRNNLKLVCIKEINEMSVKVCNSIIFMTKKRYITYL